MQCFSHNKTLLTVDVIVQAALNGTDIDRTAEF